LLFSSEMCRDHCVSAKFTMHVMHLCVINITFIMPKDSTMYIKPEKHKSILIRNSRI